MRRILFTLITVIMMAAPRVALACPVCFGQSDAPMARATNLGILAMLVVVVGMLASFAAFFIYLNRRARLVAESNDTNTGTGPAEPGHYLSDPQKGTAQC